MMDKDFEKYRTTYASQIPAEVLLDWLVTIAWATAADHYYDPPALVTFHPTPPDAEDSYFNVLGSDNDPKTSLPEAIKRAYFKLKDREKEDRREQYETLKKEFEPES